MSQVLSLRDLHDHLCRAGIEISYSSLSALVAAGDIGKQLHAGGSNNRREFPQEAAMVLEQFIPIYRQYGGRLPSAPDLLRKFLESTQTTNGGSTELVLSRISSGVLVTAQQPDPLQLAEAQGRAQGLAITEQVLIAREAAEFLHIGVRTLRACVPPYRRFGKGPEGDRWLRSDLLARR